MHIERLKLLQFRNFAALNFAPSKGINILYGDNAQGKTNVLEAISFCATAKSHRTNKDNQVIQWDHDAAYIGLDLQKSNVDYKIEVRLQKSQKKQIKISGSPISKLSDMMGVLNIVFFSPEDLFLVKNGPGVRRRFLDIELSQLRPGYFYLLQCYSKALAQRNALLKEISFGRSSEVQLDAWDELLAKYGKELSIARYLFLDRMSPIAGEIHSVLSNGEEELSIRLSSDISEDGDAEQEILDALKKARQDDLRRGMTTKGAHRDDIEIRINDRDARIYASQGQQRSIALSMRCSELTLAENVNGERPILLLDDVMSELDSSRRGFLLEIAQQQQTIITNADKIEYPNASIFKVENGVLA